MADETFLNDTWNLYFHDPYDENWNYTSYHPVETITTIETFWKVHQQLKDKVQCGMFFIMRDGIFPCWDDESNKGGGCLSIKVLKQDMQKFWEALCISLLGECILQPSVRDAMWSNVNGISTSPKKHFCIIKIWLKNNDCTDKNLFCIPSNYYGDILYRSNLENIEQNNATIVLTRS
jgi:hypothetical protein